MKYKFKILLFVLLAYFAVMFAQTQSGWTIETLKEYFERRFMNLELQVNKIEGIELNLDSKIKDNSDEIERIKNIKRGGEIVWAYIVAVLAFTISIANLIINIQKRNAK